MPACKKCNKNEELFNIGELPEPVREKLEFTEGYVCLSCLEIAGKAGFGKGQLRECARGNYNCPNYATQKEKKAKNRLRCLPAKCPTAGTDYLIPRYAPAQCICFPCYKTMLQTCKTTDSPPPATPRTISEVTTPFYHIDYAPEPNETVDDKLDIRSYHCFTSCGEDGIIMARAISCYCNACLKRDFSQCTKGGGKTFVKQKLLDTANDCELEHEYPYEPIEDAPEEEDEAFIDAQWGEEFEWSVLGPHANKLLKNCTSEEEKRQVKQANEVKRAQKALKDVPITK